MFYSPCPPKLASYFSFSSLNNTLQWAVTFPSFSHISPLCYKWSLSDSIRAWIASEMHSTLTKIRRRIFFEDLIHNVMNPQMGFIWQSMSTQRLFLTLGVCNMTLSWGSIGKKSSFTEEHTWLPLSGFRKGGGRGSVVLHCVCGKGIGWRRILWP